MPICRSLLLLLALGAAPLAAVEFTISQLAIERRFHWGDEQLQDQRGKIELRLFAELGEGRIPLRWRAPQAGKTATDTGEPLKLSGDSATWGPMSRTSGAVDLIFEANRKPAASFSVRGTIAIEFGKGALQVVELKPLKDHIGATVRVGGSDELTVRLESTEEGSVTLHYSEPLARRLAEVLWRDAQGAFVYIGQSSDGSPLTRATFSGDLPLDGSLALAVFEGVERLDVPLVVENVPLQGEPGGTTDAQRKEQEEMREFREKTNAEGKPAPVDRGRVDVAPRAPVGEEFDTWRPDAASGR